MRHPAAVPALAILAGTTAACFTAVPPGWPAAFSVAAWLAALGLRSRPRPFLTAVLLAFLCSAWALGASAFRRTECPPLRTALAGGPPTVLLRGRLRADAALSSNGVVLDLNVTEAAAGPTAEAPRVDARGGVRLSVGGALAAGQRDAWRAGRTLLLSSSVREPGRLQDPGVGDSRLDLARRGVAMVGRVKSAALVEVASPGTWWQERAGAARHFAREAIARHVGRWGPRSAAIVVAILIGDRAGLDEEVERKLREAGTYHVIAISGGNIAILAALLFAMLRLLCVPLRPTCWLVIAGLCAYASLVGGGASVVRATVMAVAYLVARQADFRTAPLNAVAATCAAILVATPLSLTDVGFWLTFGATLGILTGAGLLSPGRVRRGRNGWSGDPEAGARVGAEAWPARWLRLPKALLMASVAAELALFPVSAYAFSRVTFAGLVLNFLAIPLMSVVQVAGMAVLALAAVGMPGTSLAGWVAHVGAEGLVRSGGLVDLAPGLSWRLPPPHPVTIACYYGAWCLWLALRRGADPLTAAHRAVPGARARRTARRAAALAITLPAAWILTSPVTLLLPGVSGRLRVTVLDVGHADAILVQLPDRRSLLVDAGGSVTGGTFDIGGRVIAPALWALGTRRLDLLILSHGDPDHVGGAASVIDDFRPREIWEGVPVPRSTALARLREQARRAGIPWRERRAGERVRFGEVELHLLHPPAPDWERQKVRNDDSLVVDLRYRGLSIVLPGDIGRAVEADLAERFSPAEVRILKVPHHGSTTSSSPGFLEALRPRVAIISAAGTTRVTDDVLARYRAVGATVLRTSDEGAVMVTSDGERVTVETFTGRRFDDTTKNTKNTKGNR